MAEIEFAKLSLSSNGSSVRTLTAQLVLGGNEGDDDDAETFDGAEVVQPLGLISRPSLTPTTEAAYVRVGDEIVVLAILDKGAATLTLEEGETRLYGAKEHTASLRMRANGDVNLDAKAAQTIYLNLAGTGGQSVARVNDSIDAGVLVFAFVPNAGPTPASLAINYTPPGGSTQVLPAGSGSLLLGGKIAAGAANVKA